MFEEDAYPELEGVGEEALSRAAVKGAGRNLGSVFDVMAVRGTDIRTVFAVGAMANSGNVINCLCMLVPTVESASQLRFASFPCAGHGH